MKSVRGHKSPKDWLPPLLWGCLIGLGLGLLFGWAIWPPRWVDAELALLAPEQKTRYIELVGLAYGQDRDLDQAALRLHALQEDDLAARIAPLALARIRQGDDSGATLGLAMLAQDLGAPSPIIADYVRAQTGDALAPSGGSP